MLRAQRVIAVSPDSGFAEQLGAVLQTIGAPVEIHSAVEDVSQGAALWVVHLVDDRSDRVRRAHDRCPIIAIAPHAGLISALEIMEASDRVVGVMIAETVDPAQLLALASRVLADDPFGLAHLMAPGTRIHARTVADYQDKLSCTSAIGRFAEHAGARRSREPIEHCVDEMLMNALYDAPIGEDRKPLFAEIGGRDRARLRSTQTVSVHYAADSTQIGVSVRDAFGALTRATVLRFLRKSLFSAEPVDQRAGGAGLGLYLMLNAAREVYFHVLPGAATEVICMFDATGATAGLEQVGFVLQYDPRGRSPTPPSRVVTARRHLGLPLAIVGALGAAGVAAALIYPRFRSQPPPTLELDSKPSGATIAIDGKPAGTAPATLTTLAAGTTVEVMFERSGYRAARARVAVPGSGQRAAHVQPLERADDRVLVHFTSNPPGAQVRRAGELETADRTYTPADVFVEADQPQVFTLTMPRHVPLFLDPFIAPRGTQTLERGGDLPAGAKIRFEPPLGGTVSVAGAPHCQALAVPAACVLAPGTYTAEWIGPLGARLEHAVVVGDTDAVERFE